jgi:hypothetical protein
MCKIILDVKYLTSSTKNELLTFDDDKSAEERIEQLKNNEQVIRIRRFSRMETLTRINVWDESH